MGGELEGERKAYKKEPSPQPAPAGGGALQGPLPLFSGRPEWRPPTGAPSLAERQHEVLVLLVHRELDLVAPLEVDPQLLGRA